MQRRSIERTKEFDKDLKKLGKKHHGLTEKVDIVLDEVAIGKVEGERLMGFGEYELYKIRCGTRGMGKRKAARIIYYKGDLVIVTLIIFFKNVRTDIPHKEIAERLAKYLGVNRL